MVPHLIHNTKVFLTLSWLLVLGTKDHASMVGWQWGSIHLSTKLQDNMCQFLQPTYSFIQIDPFGKKVSFQSAPSMFQLKFFCFLCLLEYMVLFIPILRVDFACAQYNYVRQAGMETVDTLVEFRDRIFACKSKYN